MNKNRPVNLDISTISLPVTAIISILHRISGVILFAVVALLLWALHTSLASEEGFAQVGQVFGHPIAKIVLWGSLAALAYHLVAGVRHLIMDAGVGESLEGGRMGAKIVAVVAVILIALAGVWVW
ncbi:succinate dehydrogenase, cytochrome b556 subunit [Marinibactrum halimedae]|uniref:Succinate dehydrogenase cytochrome b556 subunit n=1 Tax=Marinibactrum halimedae TaxID=1444977 RepID=A0AA37T3A2_9GAMM|nr:succinate dehydrogenase, cytochrome b556 subunit [Marinibactrum halimedae]MCD9458669.1 succinate dehydrogenase, cytochrome b556 subunit [Marinibactrum halimedae]GLS25965.1 succinate dehydrogenase, cytochrome b556 subunit [Marinibactrum halimedae]